MKLLSEILFYISAVVGTLGVIFSAPPVMYYFHKWAMLWAY